jgi:hypothetical protein
MNRPPLQLPGGGGLTRATPMWHPPIPIEWILSFLLVLAASNIDALPSFLVKTLLHPAGFFFTFLFAIAAFDAGYAVAPFAILFMLLMLWVARDRREGFQMAGVGAVDWVQNNKRWFVESVLKEKPAGIREKDVNTYPVQGDTPSN